jgi:transposase
MRRVWAFVIVLACSRYMFVRPVFIMDQRTWTQCHVEAFAFFGGVPRRLVSDNLKTGVLKADIYDPLLNRSYAELAAHYRTLIDPARALKPKDKAWATDCTSWLDVREDVVVMRFGHRRRWCRTHPAAVRRAA